MCCMRLAEIQDAKSRHHSGHHSTTLSAISSQLRHVSTIGKKNLLISNSKISCICPRSMGNFGPLAAEIGSGVWGTPANFNGFRVLAALLHGTLVVGVNQTLRRWSRTQPQQRRSWHRRAAVTDKFLNALLIVIVVWWWIFHLPVVLRGA